MGNILRELIPRKTRLWIYVFVFLASLVLAAYTGSEGNWLGFFVSLVASLESVLAAANINPPPEEAATAPLEQLVATLEARGATLVDLADLGLPMNAERGEPSEAEDRELEAVVGFEEG